jgi:hypothetical protein
MPSADRQQPTSAWDFVLKAWNCVEKENVNRNKDLCSVGRAKCQNGRLENAQACRFWNEAVETSL